MKQHRNGRWLYAAHPLNAAINAGRPAQGNTQAKATAQKQCKAEAKINKAAGALKMFLKLGLHPAQPQSTT